MLKHITYSSGNMDISANLASSSAMQFGADESKIYRPSDIDRDYYDDFKDILDLDRGAGYWLWKPYIIDKEINKLNEGDYLLYTDAGVEIVNNISHLLKIKEDILLFRNMYIHEHWCKMDVMYNITGRRSLHINQCQASAMLFKVCANSKSFIFKWLSWCEVKGYIDDSPSTMPNHIQYKEHRHDQAILTCLAQKYNIKTYWWPAHYNNGQFIYDDGFGEHPYPVIFHHHRKRDIEWQ